MVMNTKHKLYATKFAKNTFFFLMAFYNKQGKPQLK